MGSATCWAVELEPQALSWQPGCRLGTWPGLRGHNQGPLVTQACLEAKLAFADPQEKFLQNSRANFTDPSH